MEKRDKLTPKLLEDKGRLKEIFSLRERAWKNSPSGPFVQKLFPHGWSDKLDLTAAHLIIEDNGIIVASARINIIYDSVRNYVDLKYFEKFLLEPQKPFGFFSKLVVDPQYRKQGLATLLDFAILKYLKNSPAFYTVALTLPYRLSSLLSLGFKELGIVEYTPEGKDVSGMIGVILFREDINLL